jgi:hypothetical protein
MYCQDFSLERAERFHLRAPKKIREISNKILGEKGPFQRSFKERISIEFLNSFKKKKRPEENRSFTRQFIP